MELQKHNVLDSILGFVPAKGEPVGAGELGSEAMDVVSKSVATTSTEVSFWGLLLVLVVERAFWGPSYAQRCLPQGREVLFCLLLRSPIMSPQTQMHRQQSHCHQNCDRMTPPLACRKLKE